MSAAFTFLDSDGVTPVTVIQLGAVGSPGSSPNHKLFLQNSGTSSAMTVAIGIIPIGTNDGANYALIAQDNNGSPGVFGTSSIVVGSLPSSSTYPFWVKSNVPTGITADANSRLFGVNAGGTTF